MVKFNGLLSVIQAIFIFCKLAGITKIAAWSWWIILLPTWGVAALMLAFFLLVVAAKVTLHCLGK